jgi:hypothetical protein
MLYLHNWYSSPTLHYNLQNKPKTAGTVRSNRKNMPEDLVTLKLKKGKVRTLSSHNLLTLNWHDKHVYISSLKQKSAWTITTGKKRRVNKGKQQEMENVCKAKCVLEFNHIVKGVDQHNHVLACFLIRKFRKGSDLEVSAPSTCNIVHCSFIEHSFTSLHVSA